MVTYYNRKDLGLFGEYLFSEERTNNIKNHPDPDGLSLEERLKRVTRADVENWIGSPK